MRIGLFGGTFDPPHVGHLILAEECRTQLNLDLLLWAVTDNPPHKRYANVSPVEERVKLVEKAICGNPAFLLSRIDIDRPGPHYAIDTMNLLRKEYPDSKLFYLMGGDSLHDLPSWVRPQDFLRICDGIGVMRRHEDKVDLESLEKVLPGISNKVSIVDAPILEISSKQIRQRIADNEGYRYYLRDAVYKAILDNQLYK
ncbi:MAG: nicotinate (nicotinamide) nucleotide adenylyltransferase [Chloroflexi bacterium HGW-Chloroflexi-4]|jgi:nicotinate-nucleotide adenylyltransferase|nr:MAG: nicotinate (nicotinamide) nucleotide adenylyltransferase [Chloroflexi bacterium HGW-Chloroflexi-4]